MTPAETFTLKRREAEALIRQSAPPSAHAEFFASLDEDNPICGEPAQRDRWRVLWVSEPLQRVEPPADAHWIVPQNTRRVAFDVNWIFDTSLENTLAENPTGARKSGTNLSSTR